MTTRTNIGHLTALEQEALRAFVRRLREHFDGRVLSVLLFGSRARNEAQPDSDVDVAVIVDQEDAAMRKAIRYLAVEIWLEYGLYLSTRVWSRTHWQRLEILQTGLYRNLRREGIELLSPQ